MGPPTTVWIVVVIVGLAAAGATNLSRGTAAATATVTATANGQQCPGHGTRSHLTRCDKYFRCVISPSKRIIWVAKQCDAGLVYSVSAGECVLPDSSWECELDGVASDDAEDGDLHPFLGRHDSLKMMHASSSANDQDNVYGINNLEQEEEDNEAVGANGEQFSGGNVNVDADQLIRFDDATTNNNRTEDRPPVVERMDEEFSGDGNTVDSHNNNQQQELQTEGSTSMELPTTPDKDGMMKTYLQRLTQLIDGFRQNGSHSGSDITPDQLNKFLALHKIKSSQNYSPAGTVRLPEDGKIHEPHMEYIIKKQQALNGGAGEEKSTTTTTTTTTTTIKPPPAPIRRRIIHIIRPYNRRPEPEKDTRIVLNSHLMAAANETPSNSQIVVNRPEGSVMFNIARPAVADDKKTAPIISREPSISEQTLKSVLELSKQLVSHQQYYLSEKQQTSSGNPSQPATSTTNTVVQPIFYAFPPRPEIHHNGAPKLEPPVTLNNATQFGSIELYNRPQPFQVQQKNPFSDYRYPDGQYIQQQQPQQVSALGGYPYQQQQFGSIGNPQRTGNNNNNGLSSYYPAEATGYASLSSPNYNPLTSSNYYNSGPFNNDNNNNPLQSSSLNGQYNSPSHNFDSGQYLNLPASATSDDYNSGQYNSNNNNNYSPFGGLGLPPPNAAAGAYPYYSADGMGQNTQSYPTNPNYQFNQSPSRPPPQQFDYSDDNSDSTDPVDVMQSAEEADEDREEEDVVPAAAAAAETGAAPPLLPLSSLQLLSQQLQLADAHHSRNKVISINGNYMSYDTYRDTILPLLNADAASTNLEVISCTAGVRHPNASDCTRYYVCNPRDGQLLGYTCPPYTAFNEAGRLCDARMYARCKPEMVEATYTITENKRLQYEAQKTLQEAKRVREQALQAQKMVQLMQIQLDGAATAKPSSSTKKRKGGQTKRKPAGSKPSSSSSLSQAGKKRKRYKCLEPGAAIPDVLSSHKYFVCMRDAKGVFKRRAMTCPNGLMFCRSKRMCTLESRC